MSSLPLQLTLALLEELPEAVAVLDARRDGLPVILANAALARLCGRPRLELCQLGLAGLMGVAADAPRVLELAELLKRGEWVTLRLAAPGGAPGAAALELRFQPLRDGGGTVTHVLGFHAPADGVQPAGPTPAGTEAVPEPRPPVQRDDRLTGLRHAEFFHELFRRDFAIAQREGRTLSLFVVDIDALGVYNDTFGRQAGDSVIRRVARALVGGLRRASDLVARVEAGRFLALSTGMEAEQARRHGEALAARVRELHMHHPHSSVARIVTVSVGVAHALPAPQATPEQLLKAAGEALAAARAAGRNRVAASPTGSP